MITKRVGICKYEFLCYAKETMVIENHYYINTYGSLDEAEDERMYIIWL